MYFVINKMFYKKSDDTGAPQPSPCHQQVQFNVVTTQAISQPSPCHQQVQFNVVTTQAISRPSPFLNFFLEKG
jgi:thymidylate synthase